MSLYKQQNIGTQVYNYTCLLHWTCNIFYKLIIFLSQLYIFKMKYNEYLWYLNILLHHLEEFNNLLLVGNQPPCSKIENKGCL